MAADPRQTIRHAAVAALALSTVGLILLLQACLGASSPPSRPAAAMRLSSPEALRPFFTALAALDGRQGERREQRPLRILQIGDSHTANDALSGRMRERLQERFGAAGRGWLPAGVPYKYFRPRLVEVSESGWNHLKPSDHTGIAFGLDAVVAESQPPDAAMTIDSTEPGGFDFFGVEYLTRPNGSAFTVQVDDAAPVRVSTAAAEAAVKRFDLELERPARRVELRAAGRPPVDLLGWAVERRTAGVVYENHGTIGATVDLLGQINPQPEAFELEQRRPALVIVAFGTNESFADGLDLDRYAARFRAAIAALQRYAPGAAILVLGPPDGNRHARDCTPVASCQPESDACAWQEPPNLAGVRSLQRRLARQQGWAYWDWFMAMGGACSIDRMTAAEPPLAMPDHVHLSRSGYETIADLLFADLMREYDRWHAQARGS